MNNTNNIFISQLNTPVGCLRVYANNKAITKVVFEAASKQQTPENDLSRLGRNQLLEYLQGARTQFDLPLAPEGTDFQQNVWHKLLNIHYGQTASYMHIAKALGKPTASRAVGAANGKNPIAIIIPCHRIIGANGSLTGYAGGLNRKSFLLNLENASFELSPSGQLT